MNVAKFSQSVPAAVHAGLDKKARELGQDSHEYIQRVLTQHVIDQHAIADDVAKRLQLTWRVVDQCVEVARQICRDGRFSEHITLEAIQQCTRDPSWLEDYARCIEDDVYKHGNPRKGPINRAIGAQIRAGIGAGVKKDSNDKPTMKRVLGEVIQSYTLFESFDPVVVRGPCVAAEHGPGHTPSSGDSRLDGVSAR